MRTGCALPTNHEIEWLLEELCVGLGVCLSPGVRPRLHPPIASLPALALGYDLASGFFVEGRISTLRGEATESRPASGTEAPYTLGLRAVLAEVRAGMRREMLRLGR